MLTVRTLSKGDIDAVADLTARVFAKEDEREGMFQITRAAYLHCPFMPPELCWVGEVDGRLVAKWQVLDFTMRIGRAHVRMGGIQGVVAEPDENHKGYATAIATAGLPEARGKGFDLVVGFAQRGAYYRRLGAVPLCAEYDIELEARQLPSQRGEDPFHLFEDAELPRLIELYNEGNAERSGSLVRTPEHWPWMVRRPQNHEIHICDEGYFGIRAYPKHLEIREIGGSSQRFVYAALAKLAALARERDLRTIRGAVPSDHPLAVAAIPYGAKLIAHYSKKSGCLGLLVNPVGLMQKLQPELERRLAGSIHAALGIDLDILCNGEACHLGLNPGASRKVQVELTLSGGGLLHLVMGYRPASSILATEAAYQGDVAPPEGAALQVLDSLFPHGHPSMWQTDRY